MTETDRMDREIEELLAGLGVEKAPASLTRRLRRIPDEENARAPWWAAGLGSLLRPGWVAAPALAAVLAVTAVLILQPWKPTPAEVQQARQELALAFGYLDRAGLRAGREIRQVLDHEVREPVKDNLSRNIPFTEAFRKEETT